MTKRILIIEDEAIIAAEIEDILKSEGYEVCGKANNGDKALDLFDSLQPDLALLDISIKGSLNGIDLAKHIRSKHNFPFVFITSYSDLNTLNEVKSTMPYGYIVKPFTENDIRSNVEIALFKFNTESAPLFPEKVQLESKLNVKLSPREYELYQNLFDGLSYKEMAEKNFISVNTVKHYLKSLFSKLNISSRHEASQLILK